MTTRASTPHGIGTAVPRGESRAVLALAGPLAVSELGTVGMAIVDTVFVGRLGAVALAALGYGSAIQFMVLGLMAGTLAGVTPLVSQAGGAGDAPAAARLTSSALWLAALLALPGTAALALGGALARLTSQPLAVSAGVTAYLHVLSLSVPPTLLFVAGRAALEGMERPKGATAIMIVGLVADGTAAAILVPRYGLVGAAMATTGVRWLMGAAMLIELRRARLTGTGVRTVTRGAAEMRCIARLGAPIGIHYALELAVFAVAATFAGWMGVATLAAWQVAMNAVQTAFVLAMALGSAGAIRLARALGAGDTERARRAAGATFRIAILVAAACGFMFAALPREVARIYTGDPTVLALVAPMFVLAAMFTVVDQLQAVGATLLYGAADTVAAAAIGLAGHWMVGLPLAWWLGLRAGWGAAGLWAGLGGGLLIAAATSAMRLRRRLGPAFA